MRFETLFSGLWRTLLVAAMCLPVTAQSSQAGPIACALFGICDDEEEEVEEVDPTGVIHTVYIVGDIFFPDEIHAALGDEIKFYNLRNSAIRVEASDDSWESTSINKNYSWSFVIQEGVELEFQKKSYGYSSMKGEILLEPIPASVDFGDLIDYEGNVIGADGVIVATAAGLGYTLAGVSGTVRNIGNGLALGLTTALGLGNN